MKNNQKVRKTLRFTQNAAVTGAAIGSVPVVYIVASTAAQNYFGMRWLSFIAGAAAVFVFAAVVEYGMKVYFPYGVSGILSGKAFRSGWRTTTLFLILTGLGLSMMFASGYMSYEGRKEAANLVAGETGTIDVEATVANIATVENQRIEIAQAEKAAASAAIADRIAAIRSANSNLVRLEQDGNAWAANKLQRLIDGDRQVRSLQSDYESKSAAVTSLLSGSSIATVAETVAGENELKIDNWKQRNKTSRALVGVFGIACILIFAFSSIVLELFEIVEGPEPETKKKQKVEMPGYSLNLKQTRTIVSETKPAPVTATFHLENSEFEPKNGSVLDYEPENFEIVSKGGQKAIWVPGFNTEPFSVSQCKSKLKQYEYKLENGKGKPETAKQNIIKFTEALKQLA